MSMVDVMLLRKLLSEAGLLTSEGRGQQTNNGRSEHSHQTSQTTFHSIPLLAKSAFTLLHR